MLVTLAVDRDNMEKSFNIRPRTKKSSGAVVVLPVKKAPVLPPPRPTTLKPESEEILKKVRKNVRTSEPETTVEEITKKAKKTIANVTD